MLEDRTTFEIAEEFVRCMKAIEKSGYAKLWSNPVWWSRKKIGKKYEALDDKLSIILLNRYGSILRQILRRMGTSESLLENKLLEVWVRFHDNARGLTDYKRFSEALWKACGSNKNPEALRLKRKVDVEAVRRRDAFIG